MTVHGIGACMLTALMRRRFSKEDWQTLLNDTMMLWDAPWRKGR